MVLFQLKRVRVDLCLKLSFWSEMLESEYMEKSIDVNHLLYFGFIIQQ